VDKITFTNGVETNRLHRVFMPNFPENPDELKRSDWETTIPFFFLVSLSIMAVSLTKWSQKNKQRIITSETQLIYEGGKKTKALSYSFYWKRKYLKETTNYLNDNSRWSSFVTIGLEGDTIGYHKTYFQDNKKNWSWILLKKWIQKTFRTIMKRISYWV